MEMNEDDKALLKVLGNNLKVLRLNRGLFQTALAEKLGISVPHLSNIENGKCWPSVHVFNQFCREFNVVPSELLTPARFECGTSGNFELRDEIKGLVSESLTALRARLEERFRGEFTVDYKIRRSERKNSLYVASEDYNDEDFEEPQQSSTINKNPDNSY